MTIPNILLISLLLGMYVIEIISEQPEDSGMERISVIVPGTKWCGPGNISEDNNSLGYFNNTDDCCRAHDRCDDLIEAGKKKHGLLNDSWFTKLSCQCDLAFRSCLHKVNSIVSNIIGKEYFTFESECFKNAYPIVKCLNYDTLIIWNRCDKYKYNTTESKEYQWFDLPWYNSGESNEQLDVAMPKARSNNVLTEKEYFNQMAMDRKLLGVPENSPKVRSSVNSGVW